MEKNTMFPQGILDSMPRIGETSEKDKEQIKVAIKIFNPCGTGTWYLTEFDGEDTFFGLCSVHEAELGYVSMNELMEVRVPPFGMSLERDLYMSDSFTLSDAYDAENIHA